MDPIRKALFTVLSEDAKLKELAPGGVHHKVAPQGSETPYIIYGLASEVPTRTFDGPSLDKDVWRIKGVGEAEQAEDIALRIREILDKATLEIGGRSCKDVYRINKFDYAETVEGERFDHVGYEYKIESEEEE